MGRWSWSNRNTVEDCKSISITFLTRHDYFCGLRTGGIEWKNASGDVTGSISVQVSVEAGNPDDSYARLYYTHTSFEKEETELDYKVQLVTTPCNFGGVRYWFICPLWIDGRQCGRRVAKLYLPPGGKYFGCRHCYNLTYKSCQDSHKFDRLYSLIAKSVPGTTPKMVKQALS